MSTLVNNPSRQRGATLVVALVMLVVLTLLVVSAIRSSNANLRIAGNMQFQEEAVSATRQATETIISNDFWTAPAASNVNVSIGMATYNVAVSTPTCLGSRPLLNSESGIPQTCLPKTSQDSNSGIFYTSGTQATVNAYCYAQQWEIQAAATDSGSTGAKTTAHQGINMDVKVGTKCL